MAQHTMMQLEGLQEVTRHKNGCWKPSCQLILSLRQFVMSSAIEEHRGHHTSTVALFPVWLQRQRVQMHTSRYSECQGAEHI